MEFYKLIFQILAFVIIIYIIYFLYKYILYAYKNKRLERYTINPKNTNSLNNKIDKITKKLSKNSNFYLKRKDKYDKYLLDNKDITSYHIITLKLFTGIIIGLIYIFECMLYKLNLNILILIIMYIVGYYLIDIILELEYSKKLSSMDNNISRIMIIMNNNYRLNKNHQEVIDKIIKELDGPIKNEFKIVKKDLNNGLDISYALKRMYDRTNLSKILYISELLSLNIKYGINIIDICDTLERDITNREKTDFYLLKLKNTNMLLTSVLAILPLFLFLILYMLNPEIIRTLLVEKNYIVIIIELILYLSYLLSISYIVRRDL